MKLLNKITIDFTFCIYLFISLYSGFLREAFIISLIVISHELGHIIMIKLFKGHITKIKLTGIGAIIDTNFNHQSILVNILVASGGIIVNLLIYLIFLLLVDHNYPDYQLITTFNLIMLVFNSFPLFPLDGYRIVKELLLMVFDYEYTYDLLKVISLLGWISVILISYMISAWGLVIIAILMLFDLPKINRIKKDAYLFNSPFLMTTRNYQKVTN